MRHAKKEIRGTPLRRVVATRFAHASKSTCGRVRGVTRCRAQTVSWSWAQGLAPAIGVQADECPAGTMATLAQGHEDIVRCIPI